MPAASAISRMPASRPARSRGSPHGSIIAVRNACRRSSRAWSMARPNDGPMLGIAQRDAGNAASQPSSASYSSSVMW